MAKCDHVTRDSDSSGMAVKAIECVCEDCENKEFCPVYMGQNCLLVKEHEEVLFSETHTLMKAKNGRTAFK